MSGNSEIIKRIDNLLKMRHLKREVAYEVAGIAHNSFSNWCRTEDPVPARVRLPALAQSAAMRCRCGRSWTG